MAADISLTIDAVGGQQAAASIDKVGASVARTGQTWDRVKAKLGSGEVLRNAAASAALLGTGAGNATQKIAALGGALAAIPGPVGLIASGIAISATVLDVFAKNAEKAAAEAEELRKVLGELGKQKLEAQGALAERIGGAIAKGGKDLRGFAMTPGAGQYKPAFDALMPGNGPGASAMAAQLAASGASDAEKQRALDIAKLTREAGGAGSEMNQETLGRAITAAMEATQQFGGTEQEQRQALLAKELALGNAEARGMSGLGFGFEGRRVAEEFQVGSGALDVLGGAGSGSEAAGRRVSSAESPLGKVINELLAKGEGPAVAEGGRLWADAMAAGTSEGSEALRIATEKAAGSTNLLRLSIEKLDATIREKAGGAGGGGAPVIEDADQAFKDATSYGRKFAEERNR